MILTKRTETTNALGISVIKIEATRLGRLLSKRYRLPNFDFRGILNGNKQQYIVENAHLEIDGDIYAPDEGDSVTVGRGGSLTINGNIYGRPFNALNPPTGGGSGVKFNGN